MKVYQNSFRTSPQWSSLLVLRIRSLGAGEMRDIVSPRSHDQIGPHAAIDVSNQGVLQVGEEYH